MSLKQFRSATTIGFQSIILSASHYPDCSIVELHLGIRADAVENLAFPFTNGLTGFKKDSLTLVCPISKLFNSPFQRYEIRDRRDIDGVFSNFQKQLEEKGFQFLAQHKRLETLEHLFNDLPNEPLALVHNQVNRCMRGITLAKLCHSRDFEQLAQIYEYQLSQLFVPKSTLERYQRLLNFLRTYSAN